MKQKKTNKKTPKQGYTPEQQDMENDLDLYTALDLLSKSEGGKIVIEAAMKDVLNAIGALTSRYKTESHGTLMAYCADLSAKLSLVQMLTMAEGQKDTVTALLAESLKTGTE